MIMANDLFNVLLSMTQPVFSWEVLPLCSPVVFSVVFST